MPSLANITVKKNDGSTDITYTGVAASAGDKSPALWRSNTVGDAAAQRPFLQATSEWNGPKDARRVRYTFQYPYVVEGTDGRKRVAARVNADLTVTIPQEIDDDDINEAAAQFSNLIGATLTKDVLKSGFAPT